MIKNKTSTPPDAPLFLSVAEAAALLRVSQVSVRRYLGQRKLKKYKVGSRTLLRRDNVLSLIHEIG